MERNLLRTFGESTPDLIYAKDTKGRFTFVNPAMAQLMGAESPEAMLGKTDFDFQPKELAQGYYDDDQAVIRSGHPLVDREELVANSTTGEAGWHLTTKVPLRDDANQIIGILGISRDITVLKNAEATARQLNVELEQRVAERTAELETIGETLAAERHLMRTLIDVMPDTIYAKDAQSRFLLANQTLARRAGTSIENLLGKTDFDFFPKEMAQGFYNDEQDIIRTGQPLLGREELGMDSKSGTVWLLTSKVPVRDDTGNIVGLVGIGRDITERRKVEQALRDSEERFRSLTELSSDWYWEQDTDLKFVRLSHASEKSGYVETQLLGKTLQKMPNTCALSGSWLEHEATVAARQPFRDLELRHVAEDGQAFYLSLSGLPIFADDGSFLGYRGIGRDITERKLSEERVQYLATHDPLTALPNRFMFSEILNLAIDSAHRYKRKLAVLFIDLDRFKNINDTLGHDAGDILLKETAARLRQCLRTSDVVARLGGDEFVILVQEVAEPDQAIRVAQKVLSAAIKPMNILGQECRVTASVGICMYPDDAPDEQGLMKNADIAMYRAKDEGKNNYQFYSADIKQRSLERLTLENNLRRALERSEFFLHYQAKRNLQSGAITGVEALLRWQHPDLGTVSPAQFIPLAEETGLIVPIGAWVLKTACDQNVSWQQQGLPALCMAVNLSVRQFYDEGLVRTVATTLESSGMKPELLELEITEGMVMQDADRAIRILREIKKLGVRLAIDDFGVGYSSLAQIKRFPIDTLKVDGSFIRDIPGNTEDRAITEAIIAMGKTLSLTVIAEGVETQEQETFLRDHSCDESQGFYFSRPIEPEQFAALVRKQLTAPDIYPPT